jgi:hypothetical protein
MEECQAAYASSGLKPLTAREFVESLQHFCRACGTPLEQDFSSEARRGFGDRVMGCSAGSGSSSASRTAGVMSMVGCFGACAARAVGDRAEAVCPSTSIPIITAIRQTS